MTIQPTIHVKNAMNNEPSIKLMIIEIIGHSKEACSIGSKNAAHLFGKYCGSMTRAHIIHEPQKMYLFAFFLFFSLGLTLGTDFLEAFFLAIFIHVII